MHRLSKGFLDRVMGGEQVEAQLIFQILVVKRMKNFLHLVEEDADRYRLQISDGQSSNSLIILASPLNYLVQSNVLTENSIVHITKYAISRIQNNGHERSVMVILNLDVVVPGYQIEKPLTLIDASFVEDKLKFLDINN